MMTQSSQHQSAIIPSKSAPILTHKASRLLGNDFNFSHKAFRVLGSDSASVTRHNKQILLPHLPSHLLDVIRNSTAAALISLGNKIKTVSHKIEYDESRHHKQSSVDSEIARMEREGYERVKEFDAYRLNAPFGPLNSNPMLAADLEAVVKTRAGQEQVEEVHHRDSLDSESEEK